MPISIVQSHRDGETVARTHVHSVIIFECVFSLDWIWKQRREEKERMLGTVILGKGLKTRLS